MPLGTFAAMLGLAAVLTLASGFYLVFNARSLAGLFSTPGNELAPGPGGRRAPRGRLLLAIGVFVAGSVACLALWSFAMTDTAPRAVESQPGEVQRP